MNRILLVLLYPTGRHPTGERWGTGGRNRGIGGVGGFFGIFGAWGLDSYPGYVGQYRDGKACRSVTQLIE